MGRTSPLNGEPLREKFEMAATRILCARVQIREQDSVSSVEEGGRVGGWSGTAPWVLYIMQRPLLNVYVHIEKVGKPWPTHPHPPVRKNLNCTAQFHTTLALFSPFLATARLSPIILFVVLVLALCPNPPPHPLVLFSLLRSLLCLPALCTATFHTYTFLSRFLFPSALLFFSFFFLFGEGGGSSGQLFALLLLIQRFRCRQRLEDFI